MPQYSDSWTGGDDLNVGYPTNDFKDHEPPWYPKFFQKHNNALGMNRWSI
jgi:hypothetical protein